MLIEKMTQMDKHLWNRKHINIDMINFTEFKLLSVDLI